MRFFFDTIIFFILFICAYWMYVIIRSFFYDKKQKIKTRLIRSFILIFLAICFSIIFYGSFIEPQIITTKTYNINIEKTSETENIKIVFISDLHMGPYKQEGFLKRIIKKVEAINPDVILLGGDQIDGKEKEANYLYPLKELAQKYPIFAVTGNHEFNQSSFLNGKNNDQTKLMRQLFEEWNIKILDNDQEVITVDNKEFLIVGVEDLWTGRADLNKTFTQTRWDIPRILLSHNPDIILQKHHIEFDLILSGHTHGGQIRLPFIGNIPTIPTKIGRAYDMGLFSLEKGKLIISSGAGEAGTRARLFCPPEIVEINLDL